MRNNQVYIVHVSVKFSFRKILLDLRTFLYEFGLVLLVCLHYVCLCPTLKCIEDR